MRRSAASSAGRERKRRAGRGRPPRGPRPTNRAVKAEPIIAPITGPVNLAPSAPAPQSSSPTAVDNKAMSNPVTPSQLGPTATPTLKIRLPRFSLAPGLSTKSASASPVQKRTGERSRRSLRRQTSTTGSSSTSISKGDGRGSRAESPRE